MEKNYFSLENMSAEERDLIYVFEKYPKDEQRAILEELRCYTESYEHASPEKQKEASEVFQRLAKEIIENNRDWKVSQFLHEANKVFLK